MHLIWYHFITNETSLELLVQSNLREDQNETILNAFNSICFFNIFLISPHSIEKVVSLVRTSKLHSKYIIQPGFNCSIILSMISYRFRSFDIQTYATRCSFTYLNQLSNVWDANSLAFSKQYSKHIFDHPQNVSTRINKPWIWSSKIMKVLISIFASESLIMRTKKPWQFIIWKNLLVLQWISMYIFNHALISLLTQNDSHVK